MDDLGPDIEALKIGEECTQFEHDPHSSGFNLLEDLKNVGHQASDDEKRKGKKTTKKGRGKGGEEKSHTRHEHDLDPIEENSGVKVKVDELLLIKEQQSEDNGQKGKLDESRQEHAEIFTENELIAVDGFGEQGVDGAFVEFFMDEANTGEDGQQDPKHRDSGQAEIFSDFDVMTKRQFSQEQ